MIIELASLIYYPIKACRGFEVEASKLEFAGLEHDRRMMVTSSDGKFLTQREKHKLALVTPVLSNGCLTLSAPGMEPVTLEIIKTGTSHPVKIWKSTGVEAIDQGETAASWFSDWLKASVRLVHLADGYKRMLNPKYGVTSGDHTGFADGYPILVTSEASLADLNSRMEHPIPMDRFRPNLVARGCEPFDEDNWSRIRIGDVALAIVKPCARCVVTTIDKQTLVTSHEPLKTLSKFRKRPGGVMFGQNAIPLNEGNLKAGTPIQIL